MIINPLVAWRSQQQLSLSLSLSLSREAGEDTHILQPNGMHTITDGYSVSRGPGQGYRWVETRFFFVRIHIPAFFWHSPPPGQEGPGRWEPLCPFGVATALYRRKYVRAIRFVRSTRHGSLLQVQVFPRHTFWYRQTRYGRGVVFNRGVRVTDFRCPFFEQGEQFVVERSARINSKKHWRTIWNSLATTDFEKGEFD